MRIGNFNYKFRSDIYVFGDGGELLGVDRKIKDSMSSDVAEYDKCELPGDSFILNVFKIISSSREMLNLFFDLMLRLLYKNYLIFDVKSYKIIHEVFLLLMFLSKNVIGSQGVNESRQQFLMKNHLRDACWINVGALGQITEIQAKIERIKNGSVDDKDSIYDAWCDLYNYCKFGIACLDYGIVGSIYGELIVLENCDGSNEQK